MTPMHPQVLKLLISGKMYSLGAAFGKQDYSVFDPAKTGLTAIDVMSYYYYLGYIYTALKLYDKAADAFRLVLVQPTHVLHKCMLNAYKKYIIVSMLAGRSTEFPKAVNEAMKSYLPRLCSEYKELAEAMNAVSGQ